MSQATTESMPNLTVHLHLHTGPAAAPVNGEPIRTPAIPPVSTAFRPAIRWQLSPPRPEQIGHGASPTMAPAAVDVTEATEAVLISTGFGKRQARRAVDAAIEKGATAEEDILRLVFAQGRNGTVQPKPAETPTVETQTKPESPETDAARDQCKSIAARYASLSANERAVFDLRHAGVDWQQVAERLGIPPKAAQRSGDRIKRKLGKAGVRKLQGEFGPHLANRGGPLCKGCHFRCAEVFGQGGAP